MSNNKRDKSSDRKKLIRRFIVAGLVSFCIGFVFKFLVCPTCPMTFVGIVQNGGYSLFLGYGLFGFGFVFTWFENRFVAWISKPARSLVLVLFFSVVYSSLIIIGVNYIYFHILAGIDFGVFISELSYIMWIEFVIFYVIALWNYARSFFFAWRTEVQNKEILKREALQLQYESLKTQVNPHFLFNSLNALTTLIDLDASSAKKFTTELSRFYRNIIQLKDKELIPLGEELEILQRYLYLQQIRFGEKFNFKINVESSALAMVIPLSVQMLIENIFKHNVISGDQLLQINIEIQDTDLIVSNTYIPKQTKEFSTGLGLNNLYERIVYLTGKKLFFGVDGDQYIVKLPLIFLNDENTVG